MLAALRQSQVQGIWGVHGSHVSDYGQDRGVGRTSRELGSGREVVGPVPL